MSFCFSKDLELGFDDAIEHVTGALKAQGFGIVTELDMKSTFREKLDIDFRNYRILGACNPNFAHRAIQSEALIGLMLPCNVVVQEADNGKVNVAAIDPLASIGSLNDPNINAVANEARDILEKVVAAL